MQVFRDTPVTLLAITIEREGKNKNPEAPRVGDFRRYKNVPRNLCGINDAFTSMFSPAAWSLEAPIR